MVAAAALDFSGFLTLPCGVHAEVCRADTTSYHADASEFVGSSNIITWRDTDCGPRGGGDSSVERRRKKKVVALEGLFAVGDAG